MKKIVFTLLMSFLITNFSTSQSGWNINKYGNGNFDRIYFYNDTIGFCFGGTGIYKTTNLGNNWQYVQTDSVNKSYRAMQFLSTQVGIVLADTLSGFYCGLISKTTDGGMNWIKKYLYINQNFSFYGLQFPSTNVGYAVGGESSQGIILKTTNSGDNWIQLGTTGINPIRSVFFINENTGWIGTSSNILITTNSGINWTSQLTVGAGVGSIYFPTSNIGYAINVLNGFKTTNGGQNWMNLNIPSNNSNCIQFISSTQILDLFPELKD
jgi:photosystem II stability/assembly factor-like uncharacterized protein